MPPTSSLLAVSALLTLSLLPSPVRADEVTPPVQVAALLHDDLGLYLDTAQLVETASRYPKPLGQVAENVTVITAEEIEAQHAHDLGEVLAQVPGLFITGFGQDMGFMFDIYAQGSNSRHTLVLIDGVRLNMSSGGNALINGLPLGIIRRIEIIKGPVSSSWGSSLGGVVNILTKETGKTPRPTGQATATLGEKHTTEVSGQAGGTLGALGYFLYGGDLETDGHFRDNWFDNQPLYAKLSLPLAKVTLGATIGYTAPQSKVFEDPLWDQADVELNRTTFSTVYLDAPLGSAFNLHLAASRFAQKFYWESQSLGMAGTQAGEIQWDDTYEEQTDNLSGRLSWNGRRHSAVLGFETGRGELDYTADWRAWDIFAIYPTSREERSAAFANAALTWGNLTLSPGLRYDSSSNSEGAVSPSLGATYRLGGDTILRSSVARGFNAPNLSYLFGSWGNLELAPERVTSVQAGVETVAVPALRLAATLFHHRVTDLWVTDPGYYVNQGILRRQGLEVEADTIPWHRLSLGVKGAVVGTDSVTRENDTMYAANLIARYDHPECLSVRLAGRYLWWDEVLRREDGSFDDFIWDLALSREVYSHGPLRAELFGVVRNLFNGSQYWSNSYENPDRWLEAGVTVKF